MLFLWYLLSPHFESTMLSARRIFLKCSSNSITLVFNILFWLPAAFQTLKLNIQGLSQYGSNLLFLSSHWIHNLYSGQTRLFALLQTTSSFSQYEPVDRLIYFLGGNLSTLPSSLPREMQWPFKAWLNCPLFFEAFMCLPSQDPVLFSPILPCIMLWVYLTHAFY